MTRCSVLLLIFLPAVMATSIEIVRHRNTTAKTGSWHDQHLARRPECLQKPVRGRCRARVVRFHWSAHRRMCLPFSFGGCGGNMNNFATERACMTTCYPLPVAASCSAKHEWLCADKRRCLPNIYRCDNHKDCFDGSDELNCTTVAPVPTTAAPRAAAKRPSWNEGNFQQILKKVGQCRMLPSGPPCGPTSGTWSVVSCKRYFKHNPAKLAACQLAKSVIGKPCEAKPCVHGAPVPTEEPIATEPKPGKHVANPPEVTPAAESNENRTLVCNVDLVVSARYVKEVKNKFWVHVDKVFFTNRGRPFPKKLAIVSKGGPRRQEKGKRILVFANFVSPLHTRKVLPVHMDMMPVELLWKRVWQMAQPGQSELCHLR